LKPLIGYHEAYLDLPLGFKPDHVAQSELNCKHFPEKMIHTQVGALLSVQHKQLDKFPE
jgi:hypothetical protein